MNSGFDEFSLALFTTLSPAGVIGFLGVALPLLFFKLDTEQRSNLNRYLALPMAVVLIGFIASATHLGTPSNALHVFWGIGRSPLSNEVFSAVGFLAVAGSYWMMSFKTHFNLTLARLWLGCACVLGVLLVGMTSVAYAVTTVISWDTPYTPLNLHFSALLAGPAITLLACKAARFEAPRYYRVLLGLSVVALVVGSVLLFLHEASLGSIANNEYSAAQLAPGYFAMVCAHALVGVVGMVPAFVAHRPGLSRRAQVLLLIASCVVLLCAVFIPRLAFYELHMTAGF